MATSIRRTTTTGQTGNPCVVSKNQKSDSELLTDIFEAYYQARRNKRASPSQMRFERNLPANLIGLWKDVADRRYKPGRSICFIINRPVLREVFAAGFRDRVIHHLLFNLMNPSVEASLIDDCYSCRVGKGTHYGVGRLQMHMQQSLAENHGAESFILKMDISGYFMNINKDLLYQLALKLIRESDAVTDIGLVEYLLPIVIFNDPTKSCMIKGSIEDWKRLPRSKSLFHSPPGCGLPIGNLTSQLFSNIYLSKLDRYVTQDLGFPHYGRYVDDFYIVHNSKEDLLRAIPQIRKFLRENLYLELHPRKLYLQEVNKGVRFLGWWVFPLSASLSHESQARMRSRLLEEMAECDNPYKIQTVRQSCDALLRKTCLD